MFFVLYHIYFTQVLIFYHVFVQLICHLLQTQCSTTSSKYERKVVHAVNITQVGKKNVSSIIMTLKVRHPNIAYTLVYNEKKNDVTLRKNIIPKMYIVVLHTFTDLNIVVTSHVTSHGHRG